MPTLEAGLQALAAQVLEEAGVAVGAVDHAGRGFLHRTIRHGLPELLDRRELAHAGVMQLGAAGYLDLQLLQHLAVAEQLAQAQRLADREARLLRCLRHDQGRRLATAQGQRATDPGRFTGRVAQHQAEFLAVRVQAVGQRLVFVEFALVQEVGARAILGEQIRRRVIREAELEGVDQRERDEEHHPGDAGEQVAVGEVGLAQVDPEGRAEQQQRADAPGQLAGGDDGHHQPKAGGGDRCGQRPFDEGGIHRASSAGPFPSGRQPPRGGASTRSSAAWGLISSPSSGLRRRQVLPWVTAARW